MSVADSRAAASLTARCASSHARQEFAGAGEEGLAGGRERHGAPVSVEQLGAQRSLKLANLLAQRGLGDEQPLRRAAEVKFLGHGLEIAKIPEVDIHSRRL